MARSEAPSKGAMLSIGISTLTTGYASAMIAFDKDADVKGRKKQPNFYGYLPDNDKLRGRCFAMMTVMSALHNLSRSIGCALLAASGTPSLILYFIGGEMMLYLVWKIVRGDYFYWVRIEAGAFSVVASFLFRFLAKTIVDFSGCVHFR